MRKTLPILLLLLLAPTVSARTHIEVESCSPVWTDFAKKNGTGILHELYRTIYEPNGIKVKISYAPWTRCFHYLKNQKIPFMAGVYNNNPGVNFIYSRMYLGYDLFTVVYHRDSKLRYTGLKSLRNRRTAWIRGYDLVGTGVVPRTVRPVEIDRYRNGLRMLAKKRIDFLLHEDPKQLEQEIAKLKSRAVFRRAKMAVRGGNFYIAFLPNDQGRKLKSIWDREFRRLYKAGKLHGIYKKHYEWSY